MKKFYLLASGVVLVTLLIGLLTSFQMPETVTQVNSVVNYAQKSAFNYVIQLKPSSLYGNQLPANSIYPTAVVSTMNFSFRYNKPEKTEEEVTIEAILANPGIWQKTLVLVPATKTKGDYNVDFSLDVPRISQIFKDIEDVTKITPPTSRQVTLNIEVKGVGFNFVQNLPIDMTGSLIKVSNNLQRRDISGAGTLDYVVNLTDPLIFDAATQSMLESIKNSTTTVGSGAPALAKLCDTMDVTFNYQFDSDRPVSNISTTADIFAIVTAPNLWTRTFPLIHKTSNDGIIQAKFPVNLSENIQLINSIIAESSVSGDSYNIIIQANITTVADGEFGRINEVFNPSLKGTIKSNVLDWGKDLAITRKGSINETQSDPNKERATQILLFGVLSGIWCAFCIFLVILYMRKKPAEPSLLDKETAMIRKKYGQRIVNSFGPMSTKADKTIILESMLDLVKIADELGKPIIQYGQDYCVIDGTTQYQFSLKDGG